MPAAKFICSPVGLCAGCHRIALYCVVLYGTVITAGGSDVFAQAPAASPADTAPVSAKAEGTLRLATYNVSLHRTRSGELHDNLTAGDQQAVKLAAVIRAVRPDVILLNEVDYDRAADNAAVFADKYLADPAEDMFGNKAWPMPYRYSGPVNTGVPSGMDLNHNGKTEDAEDAWGFGQYPGQYGMAVLSRFPIDVAKVRSFQNLKWSEMPGALVPKDPQETEPYYSADVWGKLRLSSKSFWDVPIQTPQGTLSVLASHPTPPAFDGPEDRNGCRNHDEIRLLHDYIEPSGKDYLVDDQGRKGGIEAGRDFVIVGDLNSDPVDGGSRQSAIVNLLNSPEAARYRAPRSSGAEAAAERQGKANKAHRGDPAEDTADFSDNAVGNLRADYVIPGKRFQIAQSGVFWPRLEDVPAAKRESMKQCLGASDHHLVWVDVR